LFFDLFSKKIKFVLKFQVTIFFQLFLKIQKLSKFANFLDEIGVPLCVPL